jgi:hypothetical protein
VRYRFQATEKFWKEFYALSPEQKEAVRAKWETFKADPCHPTLGTHIIWRLSVIARHRIYSAVIEKDLRITFRIDGNLVTSLRVWGSAQETEIYER